MRAWILGVAALLCILWAGVAHADPAQLFGDAKKAFDAGDYVRAGTLFEQAYKEQPHHAPLWNAARSWARAGEDVRAANLYAKYLREAPANAPDRDAAIAGLKNVTPRVSKLETHADAEVRNVKVDGKPLENQDVYVAPGEHTAAGEYAGKPVTKTVKVSAGQTLSVALSKPVIVDTPPPIQEERKPLPPVVSFIGAGLALVGGGFTIASGAQTVSRKHEFVDGGSKDQSQLDDARSSQTRTNILLGATIGVAVLTGVTAIFLTDWKSR